MAKRVNKRRRRARQQSVKGSRAVTLRDLNGGHRRSGAGHHPNRKRKANKAACRGKVTHG